MDLATKLMVAGAAALAITLLVSGYMLADLFLRFRHHVKHCDKC